MSHQNGEYLIDPLCWINKEHTDLILVKQCIQISLFIGLVLTIEADICQEIARFYLIIKVSIFRLFHPNSEGFGRARVWKSLMLTFNELVKDFFHDKIDNSAFLRQMIS